MSDKIFYKKRLMPEEKGLMVITDKYICIHETPCYCFCVPEYLSEYLDKINYKDETKLQYARRKRMLKKIDKRCSRFAFNTEEKALENLKFLKRRQLEHMKRDISFINKFLAADTLKDGIVPDSKRLVNDFYVFN